MQDRKYQEEHIETIVEKVSQYRKVLAQLPTGGGKTVEFMLIAQRFLKNTGKSVLVLVHREELMYQAAKACREILEIEPYLITRDTKKYSINRIYIGMVDSTMSRLHMFTNVGLVIIDECHIANFNKVHNIFLEELIIGFSATPKSASKKDPMNKYYSCIVSGPQISQLIGLGFLAQNITRCPADIVDVMQFQIDVLKGDYNERQMATEYKLPRHVTNVIKNYHKFCLGTKTLIFNVTIDHSKEVCECFNGCGFKAKHLDSESSSRPSTDPRFRDEREEVLHWFKTTEDAILCNVMIATVGFDEPTIKNIILNFSTLSVVKFIQCCGRGGRFIDMNFIEKYQKDYPYPLETKSYFNIIDMGGNYMRFGDWNDDRDWEYIFNHPDRPGAGIAPVKTCPNCEGLVHAATRVCTLTDEKGEICLHEFVPKPRMIEQDSEMLVMTKGINIEELQRRAAKKHQYYTFYTMGEEIVRVMFDHNKEITPAVAMKYFRTYYTLCCEWYKKTLGQIDGNIEDIADSGWHISKAKNNFNSLIERYNGKAEKVPAELMYTWNTEVV